MGTWSCRQQYDEDSSSMVENSSSMENLHELWAGEGHTRQEIGMHGALAWLQFLVVEPGGKIGSCVGTWNSSWSWVTLSDSWWSRWWQSWLLCMLEQWQVTRCWSLLERWLVVGELCSRGMMMAGATGMFAWKEGTSSWRIGKSWAGGKKGSWFAREKTNRKGIKLLGLPSLGLGARLGSLAIVESRFGPGFELDLGKLMGPGSRFRPTQIIK